MAKKDKKQKNKKKEQEQKQKTAKVVVPAKKKPTGAYQDGIPFDRIQYLEAKLILKPDRFTSVQSFRDFGAIVAATAKKTGVGFVADPDSGRRPEVREIIFMDTPDFRLYNNAFILRRRISYVDGFPVGDPEIVFKFRHSDEQKATEVDVRPKISGKYRVKFKAEVLPLKDEIGGYRILYSHNCVFGLSQVHESNRAAMSTLAKVFPAVAALQQSSDEKISLVNGGIVEEVLLPLGQLDFGKGNVGNCDVALWRTRGEHMPLVGEFAFQVQFPSREAVAQKSKDLCAQFYVTLQHAVKDWISLGTTKTGMVYRLRGITPQSSE
ncbi:MAG: hypothetical protein WBW33_13515 [Bryobacteraceae bacterium]